MKKFTKLLGVVLILTLVMSMGITAAFAGTIDVQAVLDGETYKAYKILNYTTSTTSTTDSETGETTTTNNYSYYLTTAQYAAIGNILTGAGFVFEKSADGSQYYVTNAEALTTSGVSDVAANLKTNVTSLVEALATLTGDDALPTYTATGADGEANFTNLGTGYYFITSSAGTLAGLHDDNDIKTVVEKNTMITDTKTVDSNSNNAQVGDVLNYTITLTDGKGTNLEATLTDTLSKGLTYNDDAKASINGGEAATITGAVTKNADGTTTVVYTFDAATMTTLEEGQTIVVTYTATVNADASIDGTVENTEYTEYSEQKTNGNSVETELTDLTVNKTDGTNALKGAQFVLYRTDTALSINHVAVTLTALTADEVAEALATTTIDAEGKETSTPGTAAADTVYYKVDPSSSNTTIDMTDASTAVVFGLDKDSTYYLEETKAPDGYNKLSAEKQVNLGATTSIDVVNNAGSVLPSTGGIGTTIFYVVGSVLVIAAGILLITKKRMGRE